MATEIDDSGSHGYDAPLTGTFTTDAANKVLEMGADGSADTGFTLPTDSDWLLVEVYDVNGTAGHIGFTKWQSDSLGNMGTDVDTVLSGYYTTINAEYGDSTNTFKAIATLFDTSASTATVMEADDTTGFDTVASPSYTKTSYTPPTGTWKITDTLVAPGNLYAGTENDTDPFGDSSLVLRHLFNDDATALVGSDGTKSGTNGAYTAGFLQEAYTVTTPALTEYITLGTSIPSGAHSISCFLKLEANTEYGSSAYAGNAIVGYGSFSSNTTNMRLYISDDGIVSYTLASNGLSGRLLSNSDTGEYPTDHEWHHLVVTYSGTESGGQITMYVDGTELTMALNSEQGTFTNTAYATARLGSTWYGSNGSNTFKGQMDQFDIYNKELTSTEVGEIGFA